MTQNTYNLLRCAAIIGTGVFVYGGAVLLENKVVKDTLNTDIKTAAEYFEDLNKIYIDGEAYIPKTDVETFLIIGVDKYETEETEFNINHEQADFVALVIINSEDKEWKILQ
ncbi:MAG: hypothetical protein ACI4JN_09140, partial [Ruminococcus sp.]